MAAVSVHLQALLLLPLLLTPLRMLLLLLCPRSPLLPPLPMLPLLFLLLLSRLQLPALQLLPPLQASTGLLAALPLARPEGRAAAGSRLSMESGP